MVFSTFHVQNKYSKNIVGSTLKCCVTQMYDRYKLLYNLNKIQNTTTPWLKQFLVLGKSRVNQNLH